MQFANTYNRLPPAFFKAVGKRHFPKPQMLVFNQALAAELGLPENPELASYLIGNQIFEGSEPIAMAYAGHQFGHFVPSLGDGRAQLLGEVLTQDGRRVDIQLKGSGPTAYSRRGDGLAALGPMLREYVVSEAMHALGIPTTRSLAVCLTGGVVQRERLLPGAVLTRVAASHIRVGSFEYFAKDAEQSQILLDYTLARHYPGLSVQDFIREVARRQAILIASWLSVGFIHGVMNTDNMAVSGETIDYGPCAFMDEYVPSKVFSSIDAGGRYAYDQQPIVGLWNLMQLCLALQQDSFIDELQECYWEYFDAAYKGKMLAKIGGSSADTNLLEELLALMEEHALDFTETFASFSHPKLTTWRSKWQKQVPNARPQNPLVICRNHWLERALEAAYEGNILPFNRIIEAVQKPFARPAASYLLDPPEPDERISKTFCGT